MSDRGSELNPLSCTRCKQRKVRCNRLMPECGRCKTQRLECVYPVRKKRRSARQESGAIVGNEALNVILERLQRVEAQVVPQPSSAYTSPSSPHGSSTGPSPAAIAHPTSHAPSPAPPSFVPSAPRIDPQLAWPTSLSPSNQSRIDVTAVLKDAVDAVQRLRLRRYATRVITEEIRIPKHLAQRWIRNYFLRTPKDMFAGLVDRKLVEVLPEIIDSPHIHIDAAILVIYWGVLFYGCSFSGQLQMLQEETMKWTNITYMACLRSIPGWQREASGTVMDLVAAMTTARIAAECFDEEMAWGMYKQGCEYAQGLGLHNLDSGSINGNLRDPNASDDFRKGFWEILHADHFFRLIFNKPPTITGDPWKVNLPQLDASDQAVPEALETIAFLVSSRLTIVLIQFFAMLEEHEASGNMEEVPRRTEKMCEELLSLFEEWNLHKLAEDPPDAQNPWLLEDVALNGYTCVIYMIRKMSALDSHSPEPITTDCDIPNSPLALKAARIIVGIIAGLVDRYPVSATVSGTFGIYRAYVSIAYVVRHLLTAPDAAPYDADIKRMVLIEDALGRIVRTDKDFMPLARAVQGLNTEVARKMGGRPCSTNTPTT